MFHTFVSHLVKFQAFAISAPFPI